MPGVLVLGLLMLVSGLSVALRSSGGDWLVGASPVARLVGVGLGVAVAASSGAASSCADVAGPVGGEAPWLGSALAEIGSVRRDSMVPAATNPRTGRHGLRLTPAEVLSGFTRKPVGRGRWFRQQANP
jgi:hypothetical protein